mmetsp:Transcript_126132/g.403667  ORF Transcript_126132/g.403667 Transcript_126132/m.403667 type:complete len:242 (+) Transcript_126132:562-1287(+)
MDFDLCVAIGHIDDHLRDDMPVFVAARGLSLHRFAGDARDLRDQIGQTCVQAVQIRVYLLLQGFDGHVPRQGDDHLRLEAGLRRGGDDHHIVCRRRELLEAGLVDKGLLNLFLKLSPEVGAARDGFPIECGVEREPQHRLAILRPGGHANLVTNGCSALFLQVAGVGQAVEGKILAPPILLALELAIEYRSCGLRDANASELEATFQRSVLRDLREARPLCQTGQCGVKFIACLLDARWWS